MFILSFDLEEWFHILDIDLLENNKVWEGFEERIYKNTYRILNFLKDTNLKATFFVLGWIAKKYPDLIRSIDNQGHEIGTHTLNHILIYKTSPELFRIELRESIEVIQNIINKKIRIFRAPGFSITKESLWVFKILGEEGIEVDSSIFPALRPHGGIKDFLIDRPFLIKTGDKIIKEFPINMYRIGKFKIPFSGGGYFRMIPFSILVYFSNRSDYLITYFHPRDFDSKQPLLQELSLIKKIKSYYGLKEAFEKFNKFIKKYHFVDISTAERIIVWDKTSLVEM